MNLTSKRMLQFLAMCVGAVAFTASAQTTWVNDSFENATVGAPATGYGHEDQGGGHNGYSPWRAESGDVSTIELNEGDAYSTTSYPLPGADHDKALKLNTEGDTLTRYVNSEIVGSDKIDAPINILSAGTSVYVDTLMQFTPSEDEPTFADNDMSIRLAFWVNAKSNLVMRHSYYLAYGEPIGAGGVPTNSVFTSTVIIPGQWYRLTIKMDDSSRVLDSTVTQYVLCSVFLDGGELSHPDGFRIDEVGFGPDYPGPVRDGPLFSLRNGSNKELNSISFQGTGWVDDLVVTDVEPTFGGSTTVMLTLSFNSSLVNVIAGGISKANEDTVASGTELTIYAAEWHELTSIAGTDVTYAGPAVAAGSGVTNVTGTVSALAAATVEITAAPYAGSFSTGLGGNYGSIAASDLKRWATKTSQSETAARANVGDHINDFLMNTPIGTDAKPVISAINVNGSVVTILVTSTQPTFVDYNDIIGVLDVETCEALGAAWTMQQIPSDAVSISQDGVEATITLDNTQGHFIKAAVR